MKLKEVKKTPKNKLRELKKRFIKVHHKSFLFKIFKLSKKTKIKTILSVSVLVLTLLGGSAGLYLSQQTQDLRQQASGGVVCSSSTTATSCGQRPGCDWEFSEVSCGAGDCSKTGCTKGYSQCTLDNCSSHAVCEYTEAVPAQMASCGSLLKSACNSQSGCNWKDQVRKNCTGNDCSNNRNGCGYDYKSCTTNDCSKSGCSCTYSAGKCSGDKSGCSSASSQSACNSTPSSWHCGWRPGSVNGASGEYQSGCAGSYVTSNARCDGGQYQKTPAVPASCSGQFADATKCTGTYVSTTVGICSGTPTEYCTAFRKSDCLIDGLSCIPDTNGGKCEVVVRECVRGEYQCDGDKLQTCNVNGTWAASNACSTGTKCKNGSCISPYCSDEVKTSCGDNANCVKDFNGGTCETNTSNNTCSIGNQTYNDNDHVCSTNTSCDVCNDGQWNETQDLASCPSPCNYQLSCTLPNKKTVEANEYAIYSSGACVQCKNGILNTTLDNPNGCDEAPEPFCENEITKLCAIEGLDCVPTVTGGTCETILNECTQSECTDQNNYRTCNANGTWGSIQSCSSGTECTSSPATCSVKVDSCTNNTTQCNSDNTATQTCNNGEWGNFITCTSGKCNGNQCTANCKGIIVQDCRSEGLNCIPDLNGGHCETQGTDCVRGQYQCIGDNILQTCNENGTWGNNVNCPDNYECKGDYPNGSCVAKPTPPPGTCLSDGDCATGEACISGPGTKFCAPYIDNNNNGQADNLSQIITIPTGETCDTTAYDRNCVNGSICIENTCVVSGTDYCKEVCLAQGNTRIECSGLPKCPDDIGVINACTNVEEGDACVENGKTGECNRSGSCVIPVVIDDIEETHCSFRKNISCFLKGGCEPSTNGGICKNDIKEDVEIAVIKDDPLTKNIKNINCWILNKNKTECNNKPQSSTIACLSENGHTNKTDCLDNLNIKTSQVETKPYCSILKIVQCFVYNKTCKENEKGGQCIVKENPNEEKIPTSKPGINSKIINPLPDSKNSNKNSVYGQCSIIEKLKCYISDSKCLKEYNTAAQCIDKNNFIPNEYSSDPSHNPYYDRFSPEIYPGSNTWGVNRWHPIDSGEFINYPSNRSPEKYMDIINYFNVADPDNLRYKADNNTTYCNIFANDITTAMGVEMPHWIDKKEYNANAIYDWIESDDGQDAGWIEVSASEAQNYANQGIPTLAMENNFPNNVGHIALVIPNPDGAVNDSPLIAQAGKTNFVGKSLEDSNAFTQPTYFVNIADTQN